jgi:hypothetical protein
MPAMRPIRTLATGLHLQATAAVAADVADRIAEAIARLDHMITGLRRHVYALNPNQIDPSDRPEQ